jgi:hypothetical protein
LLPENQIACAVDDIATTFLKLDGEEQPITRQNKVHHERMRKEGRFIPSGKSLFFKQHHHDKSDELFKVTASFRIITSFSNGKIAIDSTKYHENRIYVFDPNQGYANSVTPLDGGGGDYIRCIDIAEHSYGDLFGSFSDGLRISFVRWKKTINDPYDSHHGSHSQEYYGQEIHPNFGGQVKDFKLLSDGGFLFNQGLVLKSLFFEFVSGYFFSDPDEESVFPSKAVEYPCTTEIYTALNDAQFVASRKDGNLYVYNTEKPRTKEPIILQSGPSKILHLLNLKDGRFASASENGEVHIWEPNIDKIYRYVYESLGSRLDKEKFKISEEAAKKYLSSSDKGATKK